jgi:DNA-binding response OmpR family regulator
MEHILIVESSVPLSQLFASFFMNKLNGVTRVSSYREALTHLEAGNVPDLVILDTVLPDGKGLMLLKYLQSRPKYSGTHVLALTNHENYGQVVQALGADHVFEKPVNLTRLSKFIRDQLSQAANIA